jgi:hypothetical protein
VFGREAAVAVKSYMSRWARYCNCKLCSCSFYCDVKSLLSSFAVVARLCVVLGTFELVKDSVVLGTFELVKEGCNIMVGVDV